MIFPWIPIKTTPYHSFLSRLTALSLIPELPTLRITSPHKPFRKEQDMPQSSNTPARSNNIIPTGNILYCSFYKVDAQKTPPLKMLFETTTYYWNHQHKNTVVLQILTHQDIHVFVTLCTNLSYLFRGQYPRANGLSADFGLNMGADAIADPDNNVYSRQPQLGKNLHELYLFNSIYNILHYCII